MKIVFSRWKLPGGGQGPICYYVGKCLSKYGHDIIFYFKELEEPIGNITYRKFKKDFRLNSANQILFDKPDFAYGLEEKAANSFRGIGGNIILGVYSRIQSEIFRELNQENPYLYSEFNFTKNFKLNKKSIFPTPPMGKNVFYHVPSTFIKDHLIKKGYDKDKIILVPHGVDLERFKPSKISTKNFRIIFVGNAATRKGLPYLLKSFEELNKKYKNIELLVISSWITKIKLNNVVTLKKIKRSDMPRYYNSADILVLPSLEDGVPLVGLEAMGCGIPVIITRDVGFDSIIKPGYNGFLINKRDIKDLTKKIEFFIENPNKAKAMGHNASTTSRDYSWEIISKKFIEELKKLEYKSIK